MEFLAGVGLTHGYLVGVEGCAVELGLGAAVEGIAQELAGLGGHVEANLVGSAGFQVEGEALCYFAGPEGFIEGSGGFAERGGDHAKVVFRIGGHWGVNQGPGICV